MRVGSQNQRDRHSRITERFLAGTDKGVSTVVGTPNTLSHLHGSVKVGSQPSKGELVRALADMMLVGVDG